MPLPFASAFLAGAPGGSGGGGIIPSLTATSRAESGGDVTQASDFIVGGTGRGTVPGWVWGVAVAVAILAFRGRG